MAFSFFRSNRPGAAHASSTSAPNPSGGGHIDSWTRIEDRPGYVVEGWCTDGGVPKAEVGREFSARSATVGWILRFSRPDAALAQGIADGDVGGDRLGFVLFVLDDAQTPASRLALRFASLPLETATPMLESDTRAQQMIAQAWSQSSAQTRRDLNRNLPAELAAVVRDLSIESSELALPGPVRITGPTTPQASNGMSNPAIVNPHLWGSIDGWTRSSSRPGYLVEGWCRAAQPQALLISGLRSRPARIGWMLRTARADAALALGRSDAGADLGFVLFVHDDGGPVADQIAIEQEGFGSARRGADSADEGRPQARLDALWRCHGVELIERFGRTPPPEILAAIARPAIDVAPVIAFQVDRVTQVPAHGVLVSGRLVERKPGTTQMLLVDERSGAWVDVSTGWQRLPAHVVAPGCPRPDHPPGQLPGFVSLLRTPVLEPTSRAVGLEPLAIYAIARSGEVCCQRVPLHRAPQTALGIADALEPIEESIIGADAVIGQHLGPAIESWLGPGRARRTIVHSQSFGEVPRKPQTSIVVLLRGRDELIRAQLARLALDAELRDGVELIYVIDDPRQIEAVWQAAPQWQIAYGLAFRLVATTGDVGAAGALDLGCGCARGKFLALLDSDCLPDRAGWLGALLRALQSDPGCGAVGPTLLFADGTINSQGYRVGRDAAIAGRSGVIDDARGQLDRPDAAGAPMRVDAVSGACLVTRRELFDRVGGWDCGFLSAYREDAVYCRRLAALGFHTMLLPQLRLYRLEHLDHLESSAWPAGKSTEPLATEPLSDGMLRRYNAWRLSRLLHATETAA